MQYLTQNDWIEFVKRFPSANAFLNERTLVGEYLYLKRQKEPNAWQRNRLQELTEHYERTGQPYPS